MQNIEVEIQKKNWFSLVLILKEIPKIALAVQLHFIHRPFPKQIPLEILQPTLNPLYQSLVLMWIVRNNFDE